MPDPLGFLLEMLSSRPNPHAPAPALPVLAVALAARRHGVDLPAWDESACDELEEDTARDALTTLRTQLSDALLGEDASAGRELLNQALDDWQARVSVEEELADHELPGVEVTASALPHVPLPPWYERDPTPRPRQALRGARLPYPVPRRGRRPTAALLLAAVPCSTVSPGAGTGPVSPGGTRQACASVTPQCWCGWLRPSRERIWIRSVAWRSSARSSGRRGTHGRTGTSWSSSPRAV